MFPSAPFSGLTEKSTTRTRKSSDCRRSFDRESLEIDGRRKRIVLSVGSIEGEFKKKRSYTYLDSCVQVSVGSEENVTRSSSVCCSFRLRATRRTKCLKAYVSAFTSTHPHQQMILFGWPERESIQ